MKKFLLVLFCVLLFSNKFLFADPEPVSVATCAGFLKPMQELAREFEKIYGRPVLVSAGASGKLYAQIKNGAPYDIFFSADVERPEKLIKEGAAVKDAEFVYAIGELVLYGKRKGFFKDDKVFKDGEFRYLAIADPKIAPYGLAAEETLKNLGVWDAVESRLVRAQSVSEAYQYVASGSAELGFVAMPLVIASMEKNDGSFWLVPANLHQPIRHSAVILNRAKDKDIVREFASFVQSKKGTDIIKRYGFNAVTD